MSTHPNLDLEVEAQVDAAFRELHRKQRLVISFWFLFALLAIAATGWGYLLTYAGSDEPTLTGLLTYWVAGAQERRVVRDRLVDVAGIVVAMLAFTSIVARPHRSDPADRRAQLLLLQQVAVVACGFLSISAWFALPVDFDRPTRFWSISIPWGTGDFIVCVALTLLGAAMVVAVGLGDDERLRNVFNNAHRLSSIRTELSALEPTLGSAPIPKYRILNYLRPWRLTLTAAAVAAAPFAGLVLLDGMTVVSAGAAIVYALLVVIALCYVNYSSLEARWNRPLLRRKRMLDIAFEVVVYAACGTYLLLLILAAALALYAATGAAATTATLAILAIALVTTVLIVVPRLHHRVAATSYLALHHAYLRKQEQLALTGLRSAVGEPDLHVFTRGPEAEHAGVRDVGDPPSSDDPSRAREPTQEAPTAHNGFSQTVLFFLRRSRWRKRR